MEVASRDVDGATCNRPSTKPFVTLSLNLDDWIDIRGEVCWTKERKQGPAGEVVDTILDHDLNLSRLCTDWLM